MNNIDYIYYSGTSTDLTTGDITSIQSQYYVPFLDWLMIFFTLIFALALTLAAKQWMYPWRPIIKTKVDVIIRKKSDYSD